MKHLVMLSAVVGMIAASGCASLENKAVGAAGGIDAFKVETTGSTSTGTLMPNIIAGGAVSAIATSPAIDNGKTVSPVFSYAKRSSFFGEIFGIDCATEAAVYIGVPGETAADTVARMDAIKSVITQPQKQSDK